MILASPTRPHTLTRRPFLSLLAVPLAKVPPRGDGGVTDDKDKELRNLQALLDRKNGDANVVARELLDENAKLRGERRVLRDSETALKAKVAPEGAIILTGDDVKSWQTYRDQTKQGAVLIPKDKATALEKYEKLGAPDAVEKELKDGKEAVETNTKRTNADNLTAAATVAGMKLGLLKVAAKGLDVQVREVEVTGEDGKKVKEKRAFVVSKDGDKEDLTPLADHFKAEGEDVLEALLDPDAENGAGAGGGGSSEGDNTEDGIPFPKQGGGTGKTKLDTTALDKFSTNRYAHVLPQAKKS